MSTARRTKKSRKTSSARPTADFWIDAFCDYLRTQCFLADNTLAAYRRDLVRFFRWLERGSPEKLTIRELADYAAWLRKEKLAPASIGRHIASDALTHLQVMVRQPSVLREEGVLVIAQILPPVLPE